MMSEYKKIAMESLNPWCEECSTPKNLTIHHKDGNHENNDVTNLQVLCEDCHREKHAEESNQTYKKKIKLWIENKWEIIKNSE